MCFGTRRRCFETAVEYGLIGSNSATGARRRLKAAKLSRPWVEPEQLMAFLDAASKGVGRMLLAILAGAGLRIGEATRAAPERSRRPEAPTF